MKKLNKEVFLNVIANCTLLLLVIFVFGVAFIPKNVTESFKKDTVNPYYNGDKNKKQVSLMFNVYENSEVVNSILDVLNENKVKSTFFIGGSWAVKNGETLKRIVSEGHEIGNHGYSHKDHDKLDYQGNEKEINLSEVVIYALSGIKTNLFAPPSGAFDKTTLKVCEEKGYKVIMWSKDTIDWRDHDKTLVFKRATENLENGDFVLMHPKTHTLSALQEILDYYKNNGFSLVTVSENIQGVVV